MLYDRAGGPREASAEGEQRPEAGRDHEVQEEEKTLSWFLQREKSICPVCAVVLCFLFYGWN